MTERFPERPWFKAWRERKSIDDLCRDVIKECTRFDDAAGDCGILEKTVSGAAKLEALYEFCAARGKLSAFDQAWDALEKEYRESETVDCPECDGEGEEDCPHCGQSMECAECDGSGEVTRKKAKK